MVARLLIAAVVAVALATAVGPGPSAAAKPACFGAAAHDPGRPCPNPTLSVVPALADRDLPSTFPCAPANRRDLNLEVCTFGASAARAKGQIAVIGDSHARHWRPALRVVANAERWRAFSITTSLCFFSEAVTKLLEGAREGCTRWYRSALAWFADHPEVSTVFVSQNAPTPVALAPGQTTLGVKSSGFERAWRALPKTVKHIVVIRDVPTTTKEVFDCVAAVIAAATGPAGPACPRPRSAALRWDTAVSTVRRLRSPRYQAVDLTDFFCTAESCSLVIGGVLVNRDEDHITETYSRTLGPYLLRKVRRLMASW